MKGTIGERLPISERLRRASGEVIAALSAALLFAFMFLPWFGTKHVVAPTGFPLPARDVTVNAWRSFEFIDIALLVAVIVAVASAALVRAGRAAGREALLSALTAALGLVATALVLYRVIEPLNSTEREYGLFLGLLAALGVLAGAVIWMRQQGPGVVADARDELAELIASSERRRSARTAPERDRTAAERDDWF